MKRQNKKLNLEELLNGLIDGTIVQGPIRHPELPPALLKEMQRLWHSVGKAFYGIGTMEQWEIGFMRDTNPEREVFVWQRIEQATKRYLADHPKADLRNTVVAICLCSMGGLSPDHQQYWDQAVNDAASNT